MDISTETKTKNAIAWLEALLSEGYKQSRGELGNEERGFCCWGLGCYIVGLEYKDSSGWNGLLYERIGFKSAVGMCKYMHPKYHEYSLSRLNDVAYATFKEIGEFLIETAGDNFETEVAAGIIEHFKK